MDNEAAVGGMVPRWKIKDYDSKAGQHLADTLRALAQQNLATANSPRQQKIYQQLVQARDLSTLTTLLLNRGLGDAQAALDFVSPNWGQCHDWRLLPDIQPALERLTQAKERQQKVLIHGDYDADGITATALLMLALRVWGVDATYYLPHRTDDGYGLSTQGIELAKAQGCQLLVTVDCGISNAAEVEYARQLGLDVIITDHHQPPAQLPDAVAVINPQRQDSSYPWSQLAGVGVAWKLATALLGNDTPSACLQLAALGTVADLVPLLDENRVLVARGLDDINDHSLPAIAALADVAGCDLGNIDADNIAFGLAPRLNAVGRMGDASTAVELLLTEDAGAAAELAQFLDQQNQHRRQVEDEIYIQAWGQARAQMEQDYGILVLSDSHWHPGVLGIVASRIVGDFYRPTIVCSGRDLLTGSARSIPGFDIHGALTAVGDHLDKFGGHPGAAGLSVTKQDLPTFTAAIQQQRPADQLLQPVLELDAKVNPKVIGQDLVKEIDLLQPFGCGNPRPVFALQGFNAGAANLVGKDKKHLRLRLDAPEQKVWSIGFSQAASVHNIDVGAPVDVAGKIQLNEWKGNISVQVQLADIRGGQRRSIGCKNVYDRRGNTQPWLDQLTAQGSTVFVANTLWGARRQLGENINNCHVVLLPPDNAVEKVYNLASDTFCFLDPTWSPDQLREVFSALPQHSSVHFMGTPAVPSSVILPDLQLLRGFYKLWRERGSGDIETLLSLLPGNLAEPLLLDRILEIFVQAELVKKQHQKWELRPTSGQVDLTQTQAWSKYSSQLKEYQHWIRSFCARDLEVLLA